MSEIYVRLYLNFLVSKITLVKIGNVTTVRYPNGDMFEIPEPTTTSSWNEANNFMLKWGIWK
jgi:hypothetical protein